MLILSFDNRICIERKSIKLSEMYEQIKLNHFYANPCLVKKTLPAIRCQPYSLTRHFHLLKLVNQFSIIPVMTDRLSGHTFDLPNLPLNLKFSALQNESYTIIIIKINITAINVAANYLPSFIPIRPNCNLLLKLFCV